MHGINRLFKKTLIYKLYMTCSTLFSYVRESSIAGKILKSEQFKMLLKEYLNLDVNVDWLGRLYGVINPNIDINGKFDISNTIIEINGQNTNNDEYLKVWIYHQLQIIGDLFKMHNLYNYITLDVNHVGPINHDNYLIVFDLVSRQNFTHYLKKVFKHIIVLTILIAIVFILLTKFLIIA